MLNPIVIRDWADVRSWYRYWLLISMICTKISPNSRLEDAGPLLWCRVKSNTSQLGHRIELWRYREEASATTFLCDLHQSQAICCSLRLSFQLLDASQCSICSASPKGLWAALINHSFELVHEWSLGLLLGHCLILIIICRQISVTTIGNIRVYPPTFCPANLGDHGWDRRQTDGSLVFRFLLGW